MKRDPVMTTLTAKVHVETNAAIRKLASDDDRTVSYVVRKILERYLANQSRQ